MSDTTETGIRNALTAAEAMRTANQDPYGVAHALLALADERKELLNIVSAVKHYLHSGGNTTEHARLVRALDHWKARPDHPGSERPSFGLES